MGCLLPLLGGAPSSWVSPMLLVAVVSYTLGRCVLSTGITILVLKPTHAGYMPFNALQCYNVGIVS